MEQPAADVAQGTTPVLAEALTNQNMAERNQTDPIATPFVRDTCGVACSTAVCKDPADTSSMLAAASAGSPHACSTLESSSSSGSSSYGTGHVSSVYSMTASDDPDAAAAAAVEGSGASLAAFDTASEVQLMAAQVLQRKHQKGPAPRSVPVQDPIHLLRSDPDKALRARKELLMSAASTNKSSSADGGSARVAAVKEELAGVQARLRDALGLRESVSEEIHVDHYYQPPPLKRSSHDHLGCSSSSDSYSSSIGPTNKANRLNSTSPTAAAATGRNFGPKAAALSFKKATGPSSAAAAAAVPSGAAARARAAGGPVGGSGGKAAPIYFDTSSEVAEMAARVLRRAYAASLS